MPVQDLRCFLSFPLGSSSAVPREEGRRLTGVLWNPLFSFSAVCGLGDANRGLAGQMGGAGLILQPTSTVWLILVSIATYPATGHQQELQQHRVAVWNVP